MGQAADMEDVTEEAASSAYRLIQAVWGAVPISQKSYVGFLRYLASDLQTMRPRLRLRNRS